MKQHSYMFNRMSGAAVAILSVFALTAASHAQTATSPAPTSAMPAMQKSDMATTMTGSEGMKHSMMMGMESMQKMQMSGNTDRDFAMMMKIHHQQALDMAAMELKDGKSPAMKKMAKQIIAAQKKEIAMFDQWLAKEK